MQWSAQHEGQQIIAVYAIAPQPGNTTLGDNAAISSAPNKKNTRINFCAGWATVNTNNY
jgi:hypothetical protein